MSDSWQLAESFEQTHQLISSVNALAIYTKLELGGRSDPSRAQAASEARGLLHTFFQRLQHDLAQLERDPASSLPGIPPRVRQFTRRLAAARNEAAASSPLLRQPIAEFAAVLDPTNDEQRRTLIDGLTTLRDLLEQHHQADVADMLGDL